MNTEKVLYPNLYADLAERAMIDSGTPGGILGGRIDRDKIIMYTSIFLSIPQMVSVATRLYEEIGKPVSYGIFNHRTCFVIPIVLAENAEIIRE